MTTALIFADCKNRWWKRKNGDMVEKKGGDEFKREAGALHDLWMRDRAINDLKLRSFYKESKKKKQDVILNAIEVGRCDISRIAFLCHGTPKGISLGFKSPDVQRLAGSIAANCANRLVHIGLYACLTGRGKFWWWFKKDFRSLRDRKKNIEDRAEEIVTHREGFAMLLCSELNKLGVDAVITAHLSVGHTTKNPLKVRIRKHGEHITKRRMRGYIWPELSGQWNDRCRGAGDFRFKLMMKDAPA